MARFCRVPCAIAAVLAYALVCYGAVPPSEDLLPNTTKGYLSVASIEALTEAWNKTQLGQLTQDPAMKPFVDDLKLQLEKKWSESHRKLGITLDDIKDVPSGETSVAVILVNSSEDALVVTADVTGRQQQTDALLAKIQKSMAEQKGVRTERKVLDTSVVIYNLPKTEDYSARQVVYFVKDDLLIVSDHLKVVEDIISRRTQPRTDALSKQPAYVAITARCKTAAGELAPQIRWFIEPFGYADTVRLHQPKKRGTDMLKILKTEGFTAVEGVGGFVNFSVDKYELLHRTYIHAPGNKNGERFELSARMLKFPNGGNFVPPNWVPRDIAMYATINVDTTNAFENSKTLVNQIVGDEVFEDVLESIKTDENGPKIDIRKDLVGFLGNRITVLTDLQVPITPKSERLLIAVDAKNEAHLAGVIKAWMETDPDTRKREIAGHVVWEIVDTQSELPMVTIENSPLDNEPKAEVEEEEERTLPPNSAVTVAHGQLFVATHIDILTKILTEFKDGPKLAGSPDYLQIEAELARLAQPEQFGQAFVRTDDAYRGVYELLRAGKMPESEFMVGKLLNSLLGEGKEGVLRTQRIDGSKLPEFDVVRRYLGPAGMTMTTEADGWFFTGFTLNKGDQ